MSDLLEEEDTELALLSKENTAASIGIVRPKFDTRSRSSLQSVLAQYGLPEEDLKKIEKKKKKVALVATACNYYEQCVSDFLFIHAMFSEKEKQCFARRGG